MVVNILKGENVMKKVSIIIPAYNCEKTLVECLGNIVHQSLKDIELIIIDDASTDGTWSLITECERQFPDLILAIKSDVNRGPGGARNIGLMYASGEYIGFVDSDDIVDTKMYEKMYTTAKEGDYDIVDCGFYDQEKDNAIVYTSDELTGDMNGHKRSELIVSGGYLWSRIFRRELILDSGICFREKVILEDAEFLMCMHMMAKRVGNVKEILYNYRSFPSSASKETNPVKYLSNATAAMDAIFESMSQMNEYQSVQEAVEYVLFQLASYCTNVCLVNEKKKTEFNAEAGLREIGKRLRKYIQMDSRRNKYIKAKIPKVDMRVMVETYKL